MVTKFPLYAKISLILIGLYLFVHMLFIMQSILLPLIYAAIIAISISPMVDFLEGKKVKRTLAIAIVLTFALLMIGALLVFLLSQASMIGEAWPDLKVKYEAFVDQIVQWISNNFSIRKSKINAWVADTRSDFMDNSGTIIGMTLTKVSAMLSTAFLTPVYIFMILYYLPHLVKFVHKLFGSSNQEKVSEVLGETKSIIQSYLVGLFIEFGIIAVLNSIGLIILGFDYPILLGIMGALLNIIPYLGGVIGVLIFMVIAMVTKTPVYVLYVIGLYTTIQLIDNNYIVPKIIGSKVKLNALISIIAVIAGSALWGIPGMFLSIPLTAIIKLVFDRIEPLKPWGFLLGETSEPRSKAKPAT